MLFCPTLRRLLSCVGCLVAAVLTAPAVFAEASVSAVPANAVLWTEIPWRVFTVLKSEELRGADGALKCGKVTVSGGKMSFAAVADEKLELPPAEWINPTFDDTAWAMVSGPLDPTQLTGSIREETWPRNMAVMCLRGQFNVENPSDMVLNLGVRGGVIVYLNGKEVGRVGMPKDKVALDTPADDYPPEAYFGPDGKLIMRNYADKNKALLLARVRRLTDLKIPASAVQKGSNVLALEIHRAPVSEAMYTGKRDHDKFTLWTMLSLENLTLVGAAGAALPCKGSDLYVWNCPVLKKVTNTDGGFFHSPLVPVTLFGAKNGSFSGQVVVEAAGAIKGLKGVATDLKGDKGGSIPAVNVVVRYGLYDDYVGSFDALEGQMPADIAVVGGKTAMCPVWFTVRVPKDAKPESYEGKVTLQADGSKPVEVTVKIKVSDFTLPDPTEYVSFIDMAQSPETLADAYKVPLWSDAHWALIDKSFEQMAYIGCKGIYITVLRKTAFGNEHAMIRWIKKGEDSYDIDFSIAEKYLDTAMKRMGKIPAVVIYAWVSETGWEYFGGGNINKEAPLPVTYEDKIGGTPTAGDGPMWGDPKINAFLKPVFDGMRERLKTRGIEKSMLVGICTDARPFDKAIADLKAVSSGCPWMVATHPYTTEVGKTVKEAVGFMAHVWGINTTPMPSEGRTYGWKNPVLETAFPRYGCSIVGHSLQTWSAISAFRVVMEAAMTSPAKGQGLRGLGRLGADFWHILPSNQSYHSRYPHYGDDACNPGYSADYNIGRGKTCPVSCARLEMIKEGIQEMETRIYLEKALTDKALMAKLGDVAQKAQAILDDRTIAIVKARGGASTSKAADPGWLWFMGSGWQKRSENLYDAAADAAKKLK